MNIKVTTTKVEIDNESLNKGEYNIRECNFELAEEFIGLVCKALFTTSKTKLTYEQSIVNGKCNIPYEVTLNRGKVIIGVIGYEVENEELIKRYSPEPDEFFVLDGSYVEDIENQSTPTPSDLEQLEQRVSAIEIDAEQVEINTQDISDIKQEQTTQNNDILLRSLITETGSQIELTLNSTNFKMTATLKDKNGTVVNTSNEIDLPLESVVVNASYDSTTKELVLTLQNGTTVRVSIADLVSGLVSDTDYATASKGGVVKTASNYALNTSSNGTLQSMTKTYADYLSGYNVMFISKGTLENVITGKELVNQTQLNTGLDTKADKSSLVTGEGTEVTLQNTAELEFIQQPLPKGNSEQVQYSGKNKFNINDTPANHQGTTNTTSVIENGVRITATANSGDTTKYSFAVYKILDLTNYVGKVIRMKANFLASANTLAPQYRIGTCNANGGGRSAKATSTVSGTEISYTVSTVDENSPYLAIWLDLTQGTDITIGDYVDFTNVIVTIDNSDMTYEPYTNGQAPNPNFEVPISNVTGDVEVLVQNKNLFDKDNIISGKRLDSSGEATIDEPSYCTTNYFIPIKPNTSYYSSVAISQSRAFCFYDSSKNFISRTMYTGQNVITTTSDTYYMKISILLSEISTEQVEEGSTATTYTPHKEQTFTFPLGTQRLMLGDYLADDGIHGNRSLIAINSTNFTISMPNEGLCFITRKNTPYFYKSINGLCTHFQNANDERINSNNGALTELDDNEFNFRNGTTKDRVYFKNSAFTTLEQWSNFFDNNEVILEYELVTEEITPYTTEQQTAYDEIKQALSYNEQTNISGESDEAKPLFDVQAVQYKEPDYWTIAYVNTQIGNAIGGAY